MCEFSTSMKTAGISAYSAYLVVWNNFKCIIFEICQLPVAQENIMTLPET